MCLDRLLTTPEPSKPPALHGLSDGPRQSYMCFEKPNVLLEVRTQLRAMEESGKLKDPAEMAKAKAVLARAERSAAMQTKQIDYDKDGHDLDKPATCGFADDCD